MFEISVAYILDLIFGDPAWFGHPVRVIGRLIEKFEPFLRSRIKNERIAGVVLALVVIGLTWSFCFILIRQASLLNKYLGSALSIFFIYTALAVKDLKMQSQRVYFALKNNDLALARKNLSLIVGRDTHNLNQQEITRATIETVSENTLDGIISPLFYAFLGGAPLALAYKAVNTLDSMVGHKNEKYSNFGWASAKLDDAANFIPARLCVLLLPAASALLAKNGLNSFRMALRDGRKNPSPNSGIPQAAVAGALGIQLGGMNFYNSQPVFKEVIGDNINPLGIGQIKESIKISFVCSLLGLICGIFLIYGIGGR